jgi:hypothetical protein
MFKVGEKVIFIHKPNEVYVAASINGDRISVFPVGGGTKYTNVSTSLFISNRIYLRRKKLNKICSKLNTLI